jgi:hypothetical protein
MAPGRARRSGAASPPIAIGPALLVARYLKPLISQTRIARTAGEPAPRDQTGAKRARTRCAPGDEEERDQLWADTCSATRAVLSPRRGGAVRLPARRSAAPGPLRARRSTPMRRTPASTPEPKAGAQCVRRARWDLRGGPPATAVPTAIPFRHSLSEAMKSALLVVPCGCLIGTDRAVVAGTCRGRASVCRPRGGSARIAAAASVVSASAGCGSLVRGV